VEALAIFRQNMDIRPIPAEVTWPLRQAIMWPKHPIEFVKLPRDNTDGIHLGLFVAEELVSIVSLFVDGKEMQFRKFATVVAQQGKGYGSFLLKYVIDEYGPELGIQRIWCNARQAKADYYRRFGLRPTTHTYEKGGISFVIMEKIF